MNTNSGTLPQKAIAAAIAGDLKLWLIAILIGVRDAVCILCDDNSL
jgi:hypothetical protein